MNFFFAKRSLQTKIPEALELADCSAARIFRVFTLLCACILFIAAPLRAHAIEKPNTIILPLKINTSTDKENLTRTVDSAFFEAITATPAAQNNLKVLTRSDAENAFDYTSSWPPALVQLQEFNSKTAAELTYVAAGSLTKLGDTVSIDIKVYNLLDPSSQTFYYLEGQDLAQIQGAVQDLSESLQKVGAAMYQQPGEPPPQGEGYEPPPPADEEDVVEGEFTDA